MVAIRPDGAVGVSRRAGRDVPTGGHSRRVPDGEGGLPLGSVAVAAVFVRLSRLLAPGGVSLNPRCQLLKEL